MLVRIGGGAGGIKEYLEKGQKQGRGYTREELDERIILDGDLEITNTIIDAMDKDGDKYLHITLAFKEDEISTETMNAIVADFKEFAFTAYKTDEYNFYAEAHLPRIKSYTDKGSGSLIERKPHIHIVIPEQNLLSGKLLNPFGKVENQVKFLEAFQETVNAKYGLASPKDNKRALFTDNSELISRYKGDTFTGGGKELKENILSYIIEQNITNYEDFKRLLSEKGEIKIRNEGKENAYLWVKTDDKNGVNLRDRAFRKDFIELSAEDKLKTLNAQSRYEIQDTPRKIEDKYADALREWHDQRAKEIKYLNSGNQKEYKHFKGASPEEKSKILAKKEQNFYDKYQEPNHDTPDASAEYIRNNLRAAMYYLETAGRYVEDIKRTDRDFNEARRNLIDRRNRGISKTAIERGDNAANQEINRARTSDNVTGQLQHDINKQSESSKGNAEFAEIKLNLDAKRLLAKLSQSHGLNPEKYEITKGQDGGDRIKAGNRNLNVSDFLTKEMNMDYMAAGQILRETYREQTGHEPVMNTRQRANADLWQQYQAERQAQAPARKAEGQARYTAQREKEAERRKNIKATYEKKRDAIRTDRRLSPAQRKAALSVAKMEKVQSDQDARKQTEIERDQAKADWITESRSGYKTWLADRAQGGDEAALNELRRQQEKAAKEPAPDEHIIRPASEQEENGYIDRRMSYKVQRNGDVIYSQQGREILADKGREVAVLSADKETIATGLRFAQAKFGRVVDVQGNAEFKRQTALVAAEQGIHVRFTDAAMNKTMDDYKRHLAEQRTRGAEFRELAKQEREKTAAKINTEKPVVEKSKEEVQRQTRNRASNRNDLER